MKLRTLIILGTLFLVGCNEQKLQSISGVVSSVTITQEDGNYSIVTVNFDDGRIVKLRAFYERVLTFQTQKNQTIFYNDAGSIQSVEISK